MQFIPDIKLCDVQDGMRFGFDKSYISVPLHGGGKAVYSYASFQMLSSTNCYVVRVVGSNEIVKFSKEAGNLGVIGFTD